MRRAIMMQRAEDITIGQAFEEFICEKKVMKLAKETIKSYQGRFKTFTDFLPADTPCRDISDRTIIRFIEFLQIRNPNIKTVSINTNVRHLRTIFYSFMELGYMDKFKIKLLKCEEDLIEVYSDAELGRLLKKPDKKKCSFAQYRNWVMVCFLLGTAIRLDTINNLKIDDVDFENHEVKLRKVKSKKAYTIPLSSTLEKTLIAYIRVRKGKPDDYLFCNQYGEQLQKDSITTAICRYNHSRGVLKTSVHLFRHTFAKNWILNKGDAFRLKAILGHSTMAMVNVYVGMWGKDLHKDFDDFNPLEKMRGVIGEREAIRMGR